MNINLFHGTSFESSCERIPHFGFVLWLWFFYLVFYWPMFLETQFSPFSLTISLFPVFDSFSSKINKNVDDQNFKKFTKYSIHPSGRNWIFTPTNSTTTNTPTTIKNQPRYCLISSTTARVGHWFDVCYQQLLFRWRLICCFDQNQQHRRQHFFASMGGLLFFYILKNLFKLIKIITITTAYN